jgi:hypothetical protein
MPHTRTEDIVTDEKEKMRTFKEWVDIIIRHNLSSSCLSKKVLCPSSFVTRVMFLPGIHIMPSRSTLRFHNQETATLFIDSIKRKVEESRPKTK